jgi:hypothetical protein
VKPEDLPVGLRKPRHGFVADDQGRLIYLPPIGGPRLVPSKDAAVNFAIAVNRCFVGLFVLWGSAAALLVSTQGWPIKRAFEWLILVFVARVVAAVLLARKWPSATGRTVNFAPVAAAALSGQGRGWLSAKLALYGFITLVCTAALIGLPIILVHSELEPLTQARAIMLVVVSAFLVFLFATNTQRVRLALRHQRRTRETGAVRR